MSLSESLQPAIAGNSNISPNPPSLASAIPALTSMSDASTESLATHASITASHPGARETVRLIQCTECSLPLRNPFILPCGNSLCQTCVPETHVAADNPSPPGLTSNASFKCPLKTCGAQHLLENCSQDVTLAKVMDRVSIEIARQRTLAADAPILLDERPHWRNIVDSAKDPRFPASRVLDGGKLIATYTLAELGELRYDSDVAYQTMSATGDTYDSLDVTMLVFLKEAVKPELDCHVCYGLVLDPLTTTCGHTFCRKCVARVLDHSPLCPICRRFLPMAPSLRDVPSNQRLNQLLNCLCPDLVAARAESAKKEEISMSGEKNVPLFVCSLAYPSMPCFLHIFEPRYRLMIRRAIESGERKFGMIMYNQKNEPQGELGNVHFVQYGTLLYINNLEMIPDGRSLLETRGLSRFRVKNHHQVDGYMVGDIERLDDVSVEQEEEYEILETGGPPPAPSNLRVSIDHMSTSDLLNVGRDFIARMQAASAPWLHDRVLHSYGPPPTDAALFPYWFASILPIADDEKYKLIPTTSVRDRLKICAIWVRRIEAQRCKGFHSWSDKASVKGLIRRQPSAKI